MAKAGALVTAGLESEGVLSPAELAQCIVAIAASKDRKSFTLLYRHFAPRLKSFYMRSSMAPNVAEELAQETLLQVWRKAALFDPARAGAGTWIFTIAKNLRIDHLRRDRIAISSDAEPADEPDEAPTGEELVLTVERETRVREALSTLSTEQAAIVRLSFFSDKAHAEIARELGIPLGTVKSRVRLALAKLRTLLDGEQ
ncbi:MAG: RNA polymerase subunit sigma [Rhizobiales bacterium 17-65-6]|nr:MAG: RNA polymerase subunit sigma [Rhizobiales bacterium 17-65-6]